MRDQADKGWFFATYLLLLTKDKKFQFCVGGFSDVLLQTHSLDNSERI